MYTRLIIGSLSTILGLSPLSPVLAAEYSSHISAPVWSSQEPLSISYGVVKVGLELMSEKRVGLCLEEGMDPAHTYQGIGLLKSSLKKEFVPHGKPCKPLNESDNFIRTEVHLDTSYMALDYLDPSAERAYDISPPRLSLVWDIRASGVDGSFLQGTRNNGYYDPPTRIGSYHQTPARHSTNPREKLYRSRAIWSSEQDEDGYRWFANT